MVYPIQSRVNQECSAIPIPGECICQKIDVEVVARTNPARPPTSHKMSLGRGLDRLLGMNGSVRPPVLVPGKGIVDLVALRE